MKSIDRTFLEELRNQVHALDIDEIKREILARMSGRKIRAPKIPSGTFVYRARKLEGPFISTQGIEPTDLSYPPAHSCRPGRLNRKGSPLFYASTSKSPLLFELGAQAGEEFVFSIWQMQASPILSSLGYTNSVFASLGAQREAPSWLPTRTTDTAGHSETFLGDDVLSELFAERVQADECDKYKITAAIAELHYDLLEGGARQFAGVIYPSVSMWANGDNIALRPWFVDSHLRWKKAIHLRVEGSDGKSFSITELDTARELDSVGQLRWAGHAGMQLGSSAAVQCVFARGRDELGDYIHGKGNIVGHWVCTDEVTGQRFSL